MPATTDEKHKTEQREALDILGLREGADRFRARSAFRRLAFDCHPDLHGGNPEKKRQFQELVKAYQTITGETPSAPPPGPEKTSPLPPTQGRDLHFRLRLAFLQAVLGGEVSMRYIRRAACPSCRGGRRRVCAKCSNMGLSDADAQIKVDVPRGIEDGEILRFRGSGNDGLSDSAAGDLYLMISVDEHPALKRRGLDIYSEVKLPASRFREGGPLEVFTIAGTRKISLPPFTTPERIFQLKGLGVTRNVGDFTESGDHFVRITEFRADVIEAAGQAPRNGLLNGAASSR